MVNIVEHLKSRHLDLCLHKPLLDFDLSIATFYCWNLSGQLVGYQQYNPQGDKKIFNSRLEGKYYTYRNKNIPTVTVWGLESLSISSGPIFVAEGIFDACRMTEIGRAALATLCNNPPKDYRNWLFSLCRPIVAICDNDAAGKKLAKFGHYVEIVPGPFDLGDAPYDYVNYLSQKYR